jgi:tellurite methyltransferase
MIAQAKMSGEARVSERSLRKLAGGEKMSERAKWDERYGASDLICRAAPSAFLYSNAECLPTSGLALDLAAGEGSNSIFLAERGLEAIALDISTRGLAKLVRVAREKRLAIMAAAFDLRAFDIPPDSFDVIVNFNYLQRDLSAGIIKGLKAGGLLMFETMTVDTLMFKPDFNPEYLLGRGELLEMFRELQTLKYRETTLQTDNSPRSVASLVARKPD